MMYATWLYDEIASESGSLAGERNRYLPREPAARVLPSPENLSAVLTPALKS